MAELIRAVTPGIFPYARKPRPKTEFTRWLSKDVVNNNEPASDLPLLSLQDELLLARLRELTRPIEMKNPMANNSYSAVAEGAMVDEDGQYLLPLDLPLVNAGGILDEEI